MRSGSILAALFAALLLCGGETPRIIYSAQGSRVKSFDPVLADDLGSFNIIGALFDTLVQYDYTRRPYTLKCSMVSEMPRFSKDFRSCRFKLRPDLHFAPHPVFKGAPRGDEDHRRRCPVLFETALRPEEKQSSLLDLTGQDRRDGGVPEGRCQSRPL